MGRLLKVAIIALFFFCGVSFGGDISSKDSKPVKNKGDLKGAVNNITGERNAEKESIDNDDKTDLYSEPDVEDVLEEIDLLGELDYELLNELCPDIAKLIIK